MRKIKMEEKNNRGRERYERD